MEWAQALMACVLLAKALAPSLGLRFNLDSFYLAFRAIFARATAHANAPAYQVSTFVIVAQCERRARHEVYGKAAAVNLEARALPQMAGTAGALP